MFRSANKVDSVETILQVNKDFFEDYYPHHYVYLLLDNSKLKNNLTFEIFVGAILYVGKGVHERVYDNFYDALLLGEEDGLRKNKKKIIQENMENDGIAYVTGHHSSNPNYALCIKDAIIDLIGLDNLLNVVNSASFKWYEKFEDSKDPIKATLYNEILGISKLYDLYQKFKEEKKVFKISTQKN